jgi:hypothetical protein
LERIPRLTKTKQLVTAILGSEIGKSPKLELLGGWWHRT